MSGVKGRSGRKSLAVEAKKKDIIDKAWRKINYKLGMSDPQSYAIAQAITVKDMVDKKEIDATVIEKESKDLLDKYNRLSLLNGN